jgi:hypothetical protein
MVRRMQRTYCRISMRMVDGGHKNSPEIFRSVLQARADPVLHELVHLVNTSHGASSARVCTTTASAASGRPSDLSNDLLDILAGCSEGNVVRVPEVPGPSGSLLDIYTSEEGMDVGHDDIDLGSHISSPVISKICHCNRQIALVGGDVLP